MKEIFRLKCEVNYAGCTSEMERVKVWANTKRAAQKYLTKRLEILSLTVNAIHILNQPDISQIDVKMVKDCLYPIMNIVHSK